MKKFMQAIRRRVPTLLLVVVIVLSWSALATACPTCKEGLAGSDPNHERIVAGYFYSILFMMSMPFVVLGTFGSCAYLSVRRARTAAEAEAADDESTAPSDRMLSDGTPLV
jgi:uncharacterized membrane protein